jgi:hypothetical protein
LNRWRPFALSCSGKVVAKYSVLGTSAFGNDHWNVMADCDSGKSGGGGTNRPRTNRNASNLQKLKTLLNDSPGWIFGISIRKYERWRRIRSETQENTQALDQPRGSQFPQISWNMLFLADQSDSIREIFHV